MNGLDLRKFKKISSDGRTTTLKNAEGHKIVIAHASLSPAMRKEIDKIPKKYADGGMVDDEEEFDRSPASMMIPEEARAASDKKLSISKEERAGMDAVRAQEGALPSDNDYGPKRPEPGIFEKVNNALALPGEQEKIANRQWRQGIAADEAQIKAAPQAPANRGIAQGAEPAQTVAPTQAPSPAAASMMQGALNQYERGVFGEAQALGQQGQNEVALQDQQIQAQQQLAADFQQKSDAAMAEINSVMEDYKKQYIKPNNYMESMSSGQKVQTAIGLLLGGMGAGLTGGENLAAKFLDNQIQRDIAAQEKNLGTKQNILSFNFQKYGNMKDAITMTEAMMKGIYATKIEQAASKAKNPVAANRALQLAAKYKADIFPEISKFSQSQVMQGVLSNPHASPLTKIQALPKTLQDNAMKELNEYSTIKNQLTQVAPVMREAFKNTTMGQKITNPIQSAQRAKVAEAQLFPIVKAIVGERMSDADARIMIQPYISSVFTDQKTLDQNIAKLEKQLLTQAQGRTPILSEYGIVQPLQGTPEVKTMGGKQYQKVPGGWQGIK